MEDESVGEEVKEERWMPTVTSNDGRR